MCAGGIRLVGWVPMVVVASTPLPLWLAQSWAAADVVKRRSRGIGLAICSSVVGRRQFIVWWWWCPPVGVVSTVVPVFVTLS